MVAVCLEKEVVFYDLAHCALINSLCFRYTHVRTKLLEKEELRRAQRLQNSVKIDIEASDEVVDMVNIISNHREQRGRVLGGSQQQPVNFLTNNIKNSVRGSELSSEKSNEKMMFRRANTESL